MTRSAADIGSSDDAAQSDSRCPACGRPLVRLVRGRCPLCDYLIEQEPVTSNDQTPYTRSEHFGRRAWWSMCIWMWGAGAGRLGHLALMQTSPAARRFSRVNVVLLAATVAVCWVWLGGWHSVRIVPGPIDEATVNPSGWGWFLLASTPADAPPLPDDAGRTVAWWWNPPTAILGAACALAWSLILGWLLQAILRRGVERSLRPSFRRQGRLGAALRYSTAWVIPLIVVGLVLLLLPLCRLAAVADWPVKLPESFVFVPAAVVAAFALSMGWFGLVRLGATVPVRTRGRVVLFCGLWAPLIAAALVVGSFVGLARLLEVISPVLRFQW